MRRTLLDGITRSAALPTRRDPAPHASLGGRNRVIIAVDSPDPDGTIRTRFARTVENVMCTVGLDGLVNLLATGTVAFTATNGWVQVHAIGTDATAPASTQTALVASTASLHISGASMSVSDAGARTLEYQMTDIDGNAYTIKEVGLFNSSDPDGGAIARSTLNATDPVIKGTADTVRISHQIIFTTG